MDTPTLTEMSEAQSDTHEPVLADTEAQQVIQSIEPILKNYDKRQVNKVIKPIRPKSINLFRGQPPEC
jgi:hypothetical protein